jgi:hypothetical protein
VRFRGKVLGFLDCVKLLEIGAKGAGIEKTGVDVFDFS